MVIYLYIKKDYDENQSYADVLCVNISLECDLNGNFEYLKTICYPLFTVENLKKYVENRVGCLVCDKPIQNGYRIYGIRPDVIVHNVVLDCSISKETLLDAYWEVVCKLACIPGGKVIDSFSLDI